MMSKWRVTAVYEGFIENEILLPEGAEISSVSIRYGRMSVELATGESIEVEGGKYVGFDDKRPKQATWKKA